MTKTIILPIRCSTVKRFNIYIEALALYECAVIGIAWFGWSLTYFKLMSVHSSVIFSNDGGLDVVGLFFLAVFGFIIPITFGGAISYDYLVEHFPTITCIQDEVTP